MKKLVCTSLVTLFCSGAALAQAPTVGQYELLTNQSWLSLVDNSFSMGAQLGYQYQPDLYLAAGLGFANSPTTDASFRLAPLVEYLFTPQLGLTGAVQFSNQGFDWLKGRLFYRQLAELYRLDYFGEYVYSENWQDMNLGVAGKYYLAANFSANADAYLQWAFDESEGSPYVRPIAVTGFSFYF